MSHSPETQNLAATLYDAEAVKPLYAESNERHPAIVPTKVELDRGIKMGEYWRQAKDAPMPDAEASQLKLDRAAKQLLDEALARNEHYTIADSATVEDLFTMIRAVEGYGASIAAEHDIDTEKVTVSSNQLKMVVAHDLNNSRYHQAKAVDAATYIITSLSLARAAELALEDADKKSAMIAMEALRDVPESLDTLQTTDVLGHHTGEIAVAAVLEYSKHN
jgi:hypothetical protein